jgi:hypothetical protein
MIYRGHIRNGLVVFDTPVPLPDGTEVRVEPLGSPADSGCFRTLSPTRPLESAEKEALRELLTAEQFAALMDIVANGGPDVEAIARMRAKSMT